MGFFNTYANKQISGIVLVLLIDSAEIYLRLQKQYSRGVLRKRCSENTHQIYRRTPMPTCDFNKVILEH